MKAQIYCTLAELISDLHLNGEAINAAELFSRIESASQFINRRLGSFLPTTVVRNFVFYGSRLQVDPVLALTQLKRDDIVYTDYVLGPDGRAWENGPYYWIDDLYGSEIEITGRWGLYEETAALSESITQTDSVKTITVTDGSVLSAGMVLLIGTEQELILTTSTPTVATSVLTVAAAETDEEITVTNGAEFHRGEVIQLSTEDMYIWKISGNTLVVGRGWNGTRKQAHLINAAIAVYRTYNVERGVNGTTAAAHTSAAASRCLVPSDVNWLAREMAGLAYMKAKTGFAGRSGNADTGEMFYYNEFPSQIKEVRQNYRIVRL